MARSFDYIVVGGGSAGCVLAGRLSANAQCQVLLIEGGGPAERHPETLRADGYKDAFINDEVLWERFSVPQPSCNNRRIYIGSGRGLGGGGSVNGMMYLRGDRADWASWGQSAWSFDALSGDFEELEAQLRVNKQPRNAFSDACISSAEEAGFQESHDLNDGEMLGRLGYQWMNFENNDRRSSYVAFVKPNLQRENLTVVTDAVAQRVLFEGKRAVGVEYQVGGRVEQARASGEVILTVGALETPKLLMLSGIGPAARLREHGLAVLHDAPEVGQNLQDHPNVTLFFHGKREIECKVATPYGFHRANTASNLPKELSDTCYVFYPARSSLREGMIRLLPGIVLPQKLYRNQWLRESMRSSIKFVFARKAIQKTVRKTYGIVVVLGKPRARGEVSLASARAEDRALVDLAYLADPEDMDTMLKGIALARQVIRGSALSAWGNREVFPGWTGRNRAGLESFVRKNVMTTYHFAGTCRMGDDPGAVVDSRLRVKGVEGLRVADSSVVPEVPVSALNAPSMVIGHRASKLLLEDRPA